MDIKKIFSLNKTNSTITKDKSKQANSINNVWSKNKHDTLENNNLCDSKYNQNSLSPALKSTEEIQKKLADVNSHTLQKIEERDLFNLKNAENKSFNIDEIIYLAKYENNAWEEAHNRELFTALNFENKAFSVIDIKILAKINPKNWSNIVKRNLLKESKAFGKSLTAWEIKFLGSIKNDEDYEKTIKELKKEENINKPPFFLYERMKGKNPEITTTKTLEGNLYRSSLFILTGEEYEKTNIELYGEKLPEVQCLLQEFSNNYPDVELTFDNDVSYNRAKSIINATEMFINKQKEGNTPFAKKIRFTKMEGISGLYKTDYIDRIWISLQGGRVQFLSTLTHENGHYKDYIENGLANKEIPEDVKPILRKVLGPYSTTKAYEAIAELTKTIETNNDWDDLPMTKKIRLRKDSDENLILMIKKNNNVSKEETDKLGKFFQDIECPKIVPDYRCHKHGPTSDYYETIIRQKK